MSLAELACGLNVGVVDQSFFVSAMKGCASEDLF
jgi:hypothetical protein